ncbi:N-acetylglucosamine kinase-like BadF-type ATPase [Microbacterium terrae]|uniref:BadF/BadG/BcrA/BcrD ATPase family protein n=1 Tax=Microbacterium terrae TaxID=69369 RepID=A0A0M2HMH2_9MICO|nr:BadF/BadG/BcrA/BcrD ATPase family protein [Microbacterium terrae]KJL45651.1 BadF/BadG/BcrA/BcrD ATPase family protein [Microbacterium terrae]MBP1076036.1 N-acetylglucosamine kinase-like BadF-type ATPase [Microbacterium terrae]GLJ96856.1 ATPase [Microbacterium terrae]
MRDDASTTAPAPGAPAVGVDVGGTKTHIVTDHGVDVVVASAVWRRGSIFEHDGNLARLAQVVVDAVGGEPGSTVVGAHGIDSIAQQQHATAVLRSHLAGHVEAVNDAVLLGPAIGADDAICVIAGTGSAVVGVGRGGETIAADGHGWLIADDASAPGLTRQLCVAVLREVDRNGTASLADPAARRLLRHFGTDDHVELALRFQAAPSDTLWGGFAPQVFAAADEGSLIAKQVIRRSGAHLAEMVQAVRARGATGTTVVAAGGVITAQPMLADALVASLRERASDLTVRVLDVPPAAGALALARRRTALTAASFSS